MKRIIAGCLILALFLFGCGGGGSDSDGDSSLGGEDSSLADISADDNHQSENTVITFTYSDSNSTLYSNIIPMNKDLFSSSPPSLDESIPDELFPNEVVIVEISSGVLQFDRQTLVEGENTIELPKDGIYLVGLFYNPEYDSDASDDAYIKIVGDIGISSSDLNSLPISSDATDSFNLGTITLSEGTYVSSMQLSDISEALGYSEDFLTQYGAIDNVARKLLNADINRNGQYDIDENLTWKFWVFYSIPMSHEYLQYEYESMLEDISSDIDTDLISLLLEINFDNQNIIEDANEAVLSVDVGNGEYEEVSTIYNDITPGPMTFEESNGNVTLAFPIRENLILPTGEKAPYVGDYKITIGYEYEDEYSFYIDNYEFYNSVAQESTLPIVLWDSINNESGETTAVEYEWFIGYELENIDPELFPILIPGNSVDINMAYDDYGSAYGKYFEPAVSGVISVDEVREYIEINFGWIDFAGNWLGMWANIE